MPMPLKPSEALMSYLHTFTRGSIKAGDVVLSGTSQYTSSLDSAILFSSGFLTA
jgi:hypothetical protein